MDSSGSNADILSCSQNWAKASFLKSTLWKYIHTTSLENGNKSIWLEGKNSFPAGTNFENSFWISCTEGAEDSIFLLNLQSVHIKKLLSSQIIPEAKIMKENQVYVNKAPYNLHALWVCQHKEKWAGTV